MATTRKTRKTKSSCGSRARKRTTRRSTRKRTTRKRTTRRKK